MVSFSDNFTISSQSDSHPIRHLQKRLPEQNPCHLFPMTSNHENISNGNCLLHWTRSSSKLFQTLSLPCRCAFVPYLLEHETNKIVVLPSSNCLKVGQGHFYSMICRSRREVYSREPCYLIDLHPFLSQRSHLSANLPRIPAITSRLYETQKYKATTSWIVDDTSVSRRS